MKAKNWMRVTAFVGAVVSITAGCDLLATKRDRANPLDPENPNVSTLTVPDFAAVPQDRTTVLVSWSVPNAPEWPQAGMVLVRKVGSAPSSATDGTVLPAVLGNGSYLDLVAADHVYYYAAYPYNDPTYQFGTAATAQASTVIPAALGDFNATAIGPTQVRLTWAQPEERIPADIVMVRKVGSNPTTMEDGDVLSEAHLNSSPFIDNGVAAGTIYRYAAWGVDTSGNVASAAVYDLANTTISAVTLYPVLDGCVMEYMGIGEWGATYLYAGLVTGDARYSLLRFESDDMPPQVIEAQLGLYVSSGAGYYLYAERVLPTWDTTLSYAAVTDSGFVTTTGSAAVSVSSGANSINITEMVQAWVTGSATNNGLRLSSNTDMTTTVMNASEAAGDRPTLSVYCSEEFQ